jgi:hypothetical protein
MFEDMTKYPKRNKIFLNISSLAYFKRSLWRGATISRPNSHRKLTDNQHKRKSINASSYIWDDLQSDGKK